MASFPSPRPRRVLPSITSPLSFDWPILSPVLVWSASAFLIAAALFTGFGLGRLVAQPIDLGLLAGAAVVMVATTIVLGVLLVHSVIRAVAPRLLVPHGLTDARRAHDLLYDIVMHPEDPVLFIVQGKPHETSKGEFFQIVGKGPATLNIDSESAALMWRAGEHRLCDAGDWKLAKDDALAGIVHLRPQTETIALQRVLTRDAVPLDIKLIARFQLEQDMERLDREQVHHTDYFTMRRALLPRDEWRPRTVEAIRTTVGRLVSELQLYQLFMPEPEPPPALAGAAVPSAAHGVLPPRARQDLESAILAQVNPQCTQWGVQVLRVEIEELSPPRELRDRAHSAYMAWLDQAIQVAEAEKRVQVELRLARASLEQARLAKDAEMVRLGTETAAQTQAAEVARQVARTQAESDAEKTLKAAEAAREAKVLHAHADAEALRIIMQARGETGAELARRIEFLQLVTARGMDDAVLRELLRALGFLERDPHRPEPRPSLIDLLRPVPGERDPRPEEDDPDE